MRHSRPPAASLLAIGVVLLTCAGCFVSREPSHFVEQRTAVEQLLFGQAVERAVARMTLPLPDGAAVAIEVVAPSPPLLLGVVRDSVAKRLGSQGLRVPKSDKDAEYLIRVVAQSLGNEQGLNLVGLPSMQSALLPIATPEIALFKEEHHQALVRLLLDVFEIGSGRHILSTRWHDGHAYFNQYVVLLVFSFRTTNLTVLPVF
jgi:hypothetical protein